MHIYFSGIGPGLGPLALIAHQAGYDVSGSDKSANEYIDYLKDQGLTNIHIGQTTEAIAAVHAKQPIDWFVYSGALPKENPAHPELIFVKEHGIKASQRAEFLNHLLSDKRKKMLAIAGTHGKTTTTAMLVWLFKQLGQEISYSVGGKISFGEMGQFSSNSAYFVYEADEYDRNFLAFHPYLSLITGIAWDHPDVYPTREEYEQAFKDFIRQSQWTILWQPDQDRLELAPSDHYLVLNPEDPTMGQFRLTGLVNRQNAWQVVKAVHELTKKPMAELIGHMNSFPGPARRFEQVAPNVYSDYAHTPEKIQGALQVAKETLQAMRNNPSRIDMSLVYPDQPPAKEPTLVVVYEGLHNTRQHFIKDDLKHLFDTVDKLYIVPSYLAREDKNLPLLSPQDLAQLTAYPEKAVPSQLDDRLLEAIKQHQAAGDLVLCLSAGGSRSLDEWLRKALS